MSRVSAGIAIVALIAGTGGAPAGAPTPMPKERDISYFYDGYKQTMRPLSRGLDAANGLRELSGHRLEAANVDEHDQVRLPSTWWTPRAGYQPLSAAEMLAATGSADSPELPWTVVKAKSQGVSPGFQILDARGVRWAIKFDPPQLPELTTAADVITSKLYWAAGYNVPKNVIVTFRRDQLRLKPGLHYKDPLKGDLPITETTLDQLLGRVARRDDGSWRAIASRFLEGKPLGEIDYEKRRRDDPEDMIPHQRRRELRGMWAINAWLAHDDCSSRNTLDMWVTDNGRSFVRHCFLDFSGTLGAASITKHSQRAGHEFLLDFGVALRNLVTLGLDRPRWEHAVDPDIPGVGFFDAATFDPVHWRPFLPNAAFDSRTARDVRWGTRIVAAFDESLIRAAVQQGRLSDPRAEDYLVQTLLQRRDKLVACWLADSSAARR